MAKTKAEAEGEVFKGLMALCEEMSENGMQKEELERGAAAMLATLLFGKTPSSMLVTAFSGGDEQDEEQRVFVGLHTP